VSASIDTSDFERRLRETIGFGHDCECMRCLERQQDDIEQVAAAWSALGEDAQLDWLEQHDRDGLGAILRGLLGRAYDGA
jgi:hypothetical protein